MSSLMVAPAMCADAYRVGAVARRAAVSNVVASNVAVIEAATVNAASFMTPWHVAGAAANAAGASRLTVATKHNQLSVPRSSPPA